MSSWPNSGCGLRYDRRFAERGEQTDPDRRSYLAFANTHARLLARLGLKPAAPRKRTIAEYLAAEPGAGT